MLASTSDRGVQEQGTGGADAGAYFGWTWNAGATWCAGGQPDAHGPGVQPGSFAQSRPWKADFGADLCRAAWKPGAGDSRKFFGLARTSKHGGSVTILPPRWWIPVSRMDEVIFQEFKGTGNCENRARPLAGRRRIFPALNLPASGNAQGSVLYGDEDYRASRRFAAAWPISIRAKRWKRS